MTRLGIIRHLQGLQRHVARVLVYWSSLALREKRLLSSATLLLCGMLVWLVLVQPALKKIDYWNDEIPKLQSQFEALELVLHEVNTPWLEEPAQTLEHPLHRSLDAIGLQGVYELQVTDGGEFQTWHLTFQNAPAEAVISWLLGTPRQFYLEVIEVHLRRTGPSDINSTAGKVSGTVQLNKALSAKEAS